MNNPKIFKILLELNNEVNQTILENKLSHDDLNFIELIYNEYSKWYINLFKEMFKMIKLAKASKKKTNDSNAEILVAIKNLEMNMNERIDNLENNLNNRIDKLENKVDLGFNNLKNHFGIDFLKQSKK